MRDLKDKAWRQQAQYKDYKFLVAYQWKPDNRREALLPLYHAVAEEWIRGEWNG